jgi:hypothetical protein
MFLPNNSTYHSDGTEPRPFRLIEIDGRVRERAHYLGERIAFEKRAAALARSLDARRIHTELAMHYCSELALLRALPADTNDSNG